MKKVAPAGAMDQIGHIAQRIIYAFGTAPEDAKLFSAKFDVKDGFWNLDMVKGEEYNFAYLYPTLENDDRVLLVVPTSLQMGWVESPPYFCVASETGRNIASQYVETPIGSLPPHNFSAKTETAPEFKQLPPSSTTNKLPYVIDVYVNDYISIAMPASQEQLRHVGQAVMMGIHDIWQPKEENNDDPISYKKIEKGEGVWMLEKEILGLQFDGNSHRHTVHMPEDKRNALLITITQWL